MEQHELLLFLVECLEKLKIHYFITGSIASMAYGEPRFTNDIDIVADIKLSQVDDFKSCFPENDFYLEVASIKKALDHRQQFNIIHPSSGLKVDVFVSKRDDFDRARFSRMKKLNVSESKSSNFASPEDVIIKKMEYSQKGGSDKHLRDIASMLKISGQEIDRDYISAWAEKLDLMMIWKSIQKKIPPQTKGS